MLATPNTNHLDRLATLAAQRTARTDRLHGSVCALLARLTAHAGPGTEVTVDGLTLSLEEMESNVGSQDYWSFGSDERGFVQLDAEVGENSYLHGDFSCPIRGPQRRDLRDFGQRAERFVLALVAKAERVVAELDAAAEHVAAAGARL